MKNLTSYDLLHVTGGNASNSDQVLSSLQGIQRSLTDLGQNQKQGPLSGQNGMMFVTMAALAMQPRPNNVVVVGGGRPRRCWW